MRNLDFLYRGLCFAPDEGAGGGDDSDGSGSDVDGGGEGGGEGGDDGGEGSGGGSGEGGADNWRDSISDENLRVVADRFNSPADAIKAVADLRKQVSTSIRVPGKDASAEEIQKFNKALGIPEGPDGYKFEMPEGKEPTDQDKAFHEKMAAMFFESGVPVDAAAKLNAAWNEMTAEAEQAVLDADKQYVEETEADLKKEWGADFERNKNLATRAAEFVFDSLDEVRQIETKEGRFLLDHPAMMKALAKVGSEMDEDGFNRIDDTERATLQEQAESISKEKHEAYAQGDMTKVAELDKKERALLEKLHAGPIVGQGGRGN